MAPAFAPGGRESVVRPGVLLVGCALPLRSRTAPGSASMGRTLYEQECAMDTWVWIVIGVVVLAVVIAVVLMASRKRAERERAERARREEENRRHAEDLRRHAEEQDIAAKEREAAAMAAQAEAQQARVEAERKEHEARRRAEAADEVREQVDRERADADALDPDLAADTDRDGSRTSPADDATHGRHAADGELGDRRADGPDTVR